MAIPDKQDTTHFYAQEALTHNEPLFRALIEHSSDIIVLITAEGFVRYVSPSITRIMGYPPEAFLGHQSGELVHPDDFDHVQNLFGTILRSAGKSLRAEYRLKCQDGSWHWFEGVATNVLDDPKVGAIVGNFRDITERKQVEAALQEEEQRFHMVWEFVSEAMALSDPEGRVLAANSAYYRLYGFKPEDVLGNTFAIIFSPEQQEEAKAQYQAFFDSEKRGTPLERTIQRADGTLRIVEASYDFLIQHGRRIAMISIIRDVTERVQAQEQLKASEDRFRALLEHSVDAISLLDREGRRLYSTPASAHIVGYEPTDYVDQETFGQIHPDDVFQVQQIFTTINQQPGSSLPAQFRVRHKNGAWVWIEGTGTNLLDHPSVQAVVVNYRDITERKASEEARQQLAAIVESSNDAIIGNTVDGIITTWNKAAERLYGYSAEEIVDQPILLLFPIDRHHEFVDIMEQMNQGAQITNYETMRVRKDGQIIPVSVTISPMQESAGKMIGVSTIARDIRQQKSLEAELRQSKQQLEVIFQNIADGVSVQDPQGNIVYMNDAGAQLCGYASPSEVLEHADFQAQRAYTLQRFEIRDEQGNPFPVSALPGSRAARGETHPQAIVQYYDTVSQTRRWSQVKARPIVDENGQVQLTVTIFSDFTETYEAEQLKEEFISMASHELKTPITALKGFSQLLKRKLVKQGSTESLHALAMMETQVNRLTRLVNDLLDVSKIQAGRLDYAEEPITLDTFIHEMVETIQQTTPSHTLVIHGASHKEIIGDRDRLEQVFLNLISNAVKYSPQANTVDIRLATSQDKVLVSVQDYGVGIPEEHQSKIFDRFFRVHEVSNKTFQGLGMGLYIVGEIVKRHHGEITVRSEEEQGSTFTVSLPLNW